MESEFESWMKSRYGENWREQFNHYEISLAEEAWYASAARFETKP